MRVDARAVVMTEQDNERCYELAASPAKFGLDQTLTSAARCPAYVTDVIRRLSNHERTYLAWVEQDAMNPETLNARGLQVAEYWATAWSNASSGFTKPVPRTPRYDYYVWRDKDEGYVHISPDQEKPTPIPFLTSVKGIDGAPEWVGSWAFERLHASGRAPRDSHALRLTGLESLL